MAVSSLWKVETLAVRSGTNVIRKTWDQTARLPGGKRLFSLILGRLVPYTGTIGAVVQELEPGHARVTLADRRGVRNHLSCVHAVALANLAELTGNLAVAYSLPDDARFIVAGMTLDYVKKARGTVTAECRIAPIESSTSHEYEIPVTLRDPSGQLVTRATLRTLVGGRDSGS